MEEYLYCLQHAGAHPPLNEVPASMLEYWKVYWLSKVKMEKWRREHG